MEDDDLFSEFNLQPSNSKPKQYLNKKHPRSNNQQQFISSPTSFIPDTSITSIPLENNEKIENVLLRKNITNILPKYNASDYENETINNENDPSTFLGTTIETNHFKGGIHETIYPENYNKTSHNNNIKSPSSSTPFKPAHTFPFELDDFQKHAVNCLEQHQSVLVSAHTSAGKTVVAQYAIAMALRDKQRVIYTSPIKALSNQKYRELEHDFKDVGLMTGDVTRNPDASCIVMTTEILRNMLFKGSEITREMAWVIFDEVHYMRDKERGVVWEETIILLSNKINYVFLSATIPNAREFAMWIAKIKSQPCNVVYTDYRPVPLQHYIHPAGGTGIYLVVNAKGEFKEKNFQKALDVIKNGNKIGEKKDMKQDNKLDTKKNLKRIVTLIKNENLCPAIVFSFSKKDCEDNAISLSKMDFTSKEEKELIELIYTNAIQTLSEEDMNLPAIQSMLTILKRGFGIHHGGMLPIVKECVELLFQEGLIKILFSTETFSMGINMPAKTVVFTSVEKWDGEQHRWLAGSEYIQMSGRAGRRGIDDKGITIMMLNKNLDIESCKGMLKGQAAPLESSFHLNYNQLLNLMRLEGMESEYIVKRSFRQFQNMRSVPKLKHNLGVLYSKYLSIDKGDYDRDYMLYEIYSVYKKIETINDDIHVKVITPKNVIPFLRFGRFVKVNGFGYGIVVSYQKKNLEVAETKKQELYKQLKCKNDNEKTSTIEYVVDTLVYISPYTEANSRVIPANISEGNGILGIVPFALNALEGVSPFTANIPVNLKENENMKLTERIFMEIMKRNNNILPLMDPIKDMQIIDKELVALVNNKTTLEKRITEIKNEFYSTYNINVDDTVLNEYINKVKLRDEINSLISTITNHQKIILEDECTCMKRVLRRLDFVNENEILSTKGHVGCNISAGDELLLTEMLFNGSLNEVEGDFLVAFLTCFLTNENSSGNSPNGLEGNNGGNNSETDSGSIKKLKDLFNRLKENAQRVNEVLVDCKVPFDKNNEYVDKFKSDYMLPVFMWLNGKNIGDICTNIYEGNFIRIIRRLDELIKELVESSELIGITDLKDKLNTSAVKLRRGLPFAASLYLPAN